MLEYALVGLSGVLDINKTYFFLGLYDLFLSFYIIGSSLPFVYVLVQKTFDGKSETCTHSKSYFIYLFSIINFT